jgi:hypothetical protein
VSARRPSAPRRPKPQPVDHAAWAICETVTAYDKRCTCKAENGRACSAMRQVVATALRRMLSEADAMRVSDVIDGRAVLTVGDAT